MASALPTELLQAVAGRLDCQDLNALARTDRRLFSALNPYLYSRGIQQTAPCFILLWACRNDLVETAAHAVRAGAKIDDDSQWETLLGHAARFGSIHMVQWLIFDQGVDINERDVDTGWTALLWAVTSNHLEVAKLLLSVPGLDVNVTSFYDLVSPLSLASAQNYQAMVGLLLKFPGIDVNVHDEQGRTPLSLAAEVGLVDIASAFATREDVDVNSRDDIERTPLAWASSRCHSKIVGIFLDSGRVSESLASLAYDTSPIWLAIRVAEEVDLEACIATVHMLLAANDTGVSQIDEDGRNLLSVAIASRVDIKIVKLLLDSGNFDITAKDIRGRNAFSWATSVSLEAMQILYNTGKVDISEKETQTCVTPLWRAIVSRNLRGLKWLLTLENVDANAPNNNGHTPLQFMTEPARWDYFEALLQCPRADVNARNPDGNTALHMATYMGHDQIVKLLLGHSAVAVNAQDSMGRTALSIACIKGYNSIVFALLKSPNIDTSMLDYRGKDAMSLAMDHANKVCVELLWGRGHFDNRGNRRTVDYEAQKYIEQYLLK